jgi:hypothetical protein
MSNIESNSRPQGELFGVTYPSIVGLVIITDRASCPACGSNELLTGSSRGSHACDVRCNCCDRRRGWLSAGLAQFLQETVSRFGRPTAPIVLRNPSPIWSSGAGASSCSNGN